MDELLDRAIVPVDGARERLLSFLVHELRNPLASALWSAEMLARLESPNPRQERLARLGLRSMRRLRALLEDMFALERVPVRAPAGRADLAEALERAADLRDGFPGELVLDPDLPHVVTPVDPVLLDRLLRACLRRAAYAGEGGRADAGITVVGEVARLIVRRADVPPDRLDPPPLVPGGSEGGGTTFSLLLARALARTLGVTLMVRGDGTGGAAVELLFHVEPR